MTAGCHNVAGALVEPLACSHCGAMLCYGGQHRHMQLDSAAKQSRVRMARYPYRRPLRRWSTHQVQSDVQAAELHCQAG